MRAVGLRGPQKEMVRRGWYPRGPWPVQLRLQKELTSEEYITEQAWQGAMLPFCPLHPEGRCAVRHGTYERKSPTGTRIARFYCRKGRVTFSLLPDFLAARFSGSLDEVEQSVDAAAREPTLSAAARRLRPELNDERSALRWLRRRLEAVQSALVSLVTSLPELFGCVPELSAVRTHLGVVSVLRALRSTAARFLPSLLAPLGFRHRNAASVKSCRRLQHEAGPDPTSGVR